MAGAHKRTTCGLTLLAIVFIIVIIILIVVPEPCRHLDPRPECRNSRGEQFKGTASSTTHTTLTTTMTSKATTPSSSTSMESSTESTRRSTKSVSSKITTGSTSSSTEATTTTPVTTGIVSTSTNTSSTEYSSVSSTYDNYQSSTERTVNATDKDERSTPTATETTTEPSRMSSTVTTKMTSNTTDTPIMASEGTTTPVMTNPTNLTIEEEKSTTPMATETPTVTSQMSSTADMTPDTAETTTITTEGTTTTVIENPTNLTDDKDKSTTPITTEDSQTPTYMTTYATDRETPVKINEADSTTLAIETSTTEAHTAITTLETTDYITVTKTPIFSSTENYTSEATTLLKSTTTDYVQLIDENSTGNKTCNKPICREVARRMLLTMDPSDINPCDDFYQYSCGGILDKHFFKPENPQFFADEIIKEAITLADRDNMELRELLIFYDSCMNYTKSHNQEERLDQVRQVFDNLGYTFNPRSMKKSKEQFTDFSDTFDLSTALAKMMKMHFAPFFDIMIDADGNRRDEFAFKMTLPSFASPFSGDLAKDVCFAEYKEEADGAKRNGEIFDVNINYEQYVNCSSTGKGLNARLDKIEEAVRAMNLTGFLTDDSLKEQILSEARFNLDFMLNDIARVMPSPPQIRKTILNKVYIVTKVDKINEIFTDSPIDFTKFFNELMTGYKYEFDPKLASIQIYFQDVFVEIFNVINEYFEDQEPAMQNMLVLLWAEQLYSDLVKPVGPAIGTQDYCLRGVTNLMDDYVSYLYLKNLPERDHLHTQVQNMIKMTKDTATEQLKLSKSTSKEDFKEKLEYMTGEVVTLDEVGDSLLVGRSEAVPVTENDFITNYENLVKYYRQRMYHMREDYAYKPSALWSVFQLPYKSNGVTSYALNKFLIPYAALNPPLYYQGVPEYINYAGIGHMISHELMHGFDSTGMEYNVEGKTEMWRDTFLNVRSECFEKQLVEPQFLNSSTGLVAQFTVHENLALNEVLADSAAVKLAWDTYRHDLNQRRNPPPPATTTEEPPMHVARRRKRDAKSERTEVLSRLVILEELGLPHLEGFTPLQLYYIKTAQNQCSASSEVNIRQVVENEHLPAKLRVNLMVGNDPKFIEAFKCPMSSKMIPNGGDLCQYNPTGSVGLL